MIWEWVKARLGFDDVQFYGGLALLGAAPGWWKVVGGILTGYVAATNLVVLWRRGARTGG